jgi:AmmeMemoRadiSam system protein A
MLLLGIFTAHPPLLIPDVGKESTSEVEATTAAMKLLEREIKDLKPETIIVFSPHGPVFQDGIAIRGGQTLQGDLKRFGSNKKWEWQGDSELSEAIVKNANNAGVYSMILDEKTSNRLGVESKLDHGTLVPLSFFSDLNHRLVAIGMAMLPREELYAFGKAVADAIEQVGRRTVVIASGDLSHCLKHGAPVPYNPRGEEMDRLIVSLIHQNDFEGLLEIDPMLIEEGAECGYRTLLMLLGLFDEKAVKSEVLSYEGPFGVGYAVARFDPMAKNNTCSILEKVKAKRKTAMAERRKQESPLVRLARQVVESNVFGTPQAHIEDLPPVARKPAGVFVSIKKHGELRGCIGTIEPSRPNVEDEIRANAISAAFHDPRFDPICEEELGDLVYSVDILMPAEPISGLEELNPKTYGVIVRQGGRTGLLLPDLDGVESAEVQVEIARRKAGIRPEEEVELYRFRVDRYT